MRAGRRSLVVALGAVVVAAVLSGCSFVGPLFGIGDGYRATGRWLAEQSVVVRVDETTPYYRDAELQGELRAELDPDASVTQIEAFARDAAAFLATQDSYFVFLSAGRGGVDLAIRDDTGIDSGMPLWAELDAERVPGVARLLVDPGAYHETEPEDPPRVIAKAAARDVPSVLGALVPRVLPRGELRVQSFRDEELLGSLVSFYDTALIGEAVPTIALGADCAPSDALLAIAVATATGPDSGGVIDLCGAWDVDYGGAPIGAVAVALRAELDAVGAVPPVTLTSRTPVPNAQERSIAVTAAPASALPLAQQLEESGVLGALGGFTLDADRRLAVAASREPIDPMLDLVVGAPAAASLSTVSLAAEGFGIEAPVSQLRDLADRMAAVSAASTAIDYATVGPDTGRLSLADDAIEPPSPTEVAAAARALRRSGLADGRSVEVRAGGTNLLLEDGTAGPVRGPDPDGTLARFRAAWADGSP